MQGKSWQEDREGSCDDVCSGTCAGGIAHLPESLTPADPGVTGSHLSVSSLSQMIQSMFCKFCSFYHYPSYRPPSFHGCHRKSFLSLVPGSTVAGWEKQQSSIFFHIVRAYD